MLIDSIVLFSCTIACYLRLNAECLWGLNLYDYIYCVQIIVEVYALSFVVYLWLREAVACDIINNFCY